MCFFLFFHSFNIFLDKAERDWTGSNIAYQETFSKEDPHNVYVNTIKNWETHVKGPDRQDTFKTRCCIESLSYYPNIHQALVLHTCFQKLKEVYLMKQVSYLSERLSDTL